MGGIGAVAEPLVVIALLIGGTWINRDFEPGRNRRKSKDTRRSPDRHSRVAEGQIEEDLEARSSSPSLLVTQEPKWRSRTLRIWGLSKDVTTPNTRRFKGYFLSRLLERFPFLVECWYWALIYWVYQLGRAATAVWVVEGTVHAARKHALQVIAAEERLHIFWELGIQQFFMKNTSVMTLINRIYSFIHIPGSIAFLVWLFYYTNTRNRSDEEQDDKDVDEGEAISSRTTIIRVAKKNNGVLQFTCIHCFHSVAMHASQTVELRYFDWREWEISEKLRLY